MAATKYTYSVSGDFPNQKVDVPRLTQEIQASSIVTALDYISVDDDTCDIWFKDALSAGDQTVLDGVVAAHSGEPLAAATMAVHDPNARFDPDGKQVIVPTPAPRGSYTWYTSNGDQLSPLKRGEGTPARVTFAASTPGTDSAEIQFNEAVYIHDGEINWRGVEDFDGTDHFSVSVKFGQSDDISSTPGTGNCNLSAPMLVAAPNNDGDYTVDLDTACPIPSSSGDWWVHERTEVIAPYVDGVTDLGKYGMRCVLMTGYAPPPLYLVRNVAMGSPRGIFEIDAYLVEWVSRHWKVELAVVKTKSPAAEVEVNGILMLFRWKATTDDNP